MTVPEIAVKGKQYARKCLEGNLFLALVIALVGFAAFGLGRLSVTTGKPPIRIYPNAAAASAAGLAPIPSLLSTATNTSSSDVSPAVGNYVASKNGTAYYLPSCAGAARITDANKIWFDTESAAENAGYHKAANCSGL